MKKILVANRGEIALRVMRSAREMGIKTVAVYSTADRNSPHVAYADEAVCIGEGPSSESYLKVDEILKVCRNLKVDGVHPGYGFLSENAGFAKKVKAAGVTFIGPTPKAIEIMGNKLAAKKAVQKYDIPMVPGTDEAITNGEMAAKIAKEIGYPILIKASAGGGGKGMRVVHQASEIEDQMKLAVSEATSAFGDGSVFVEKYVSAPRHIEIQILADKHGNVVHLFERECSIQRRHQKVIEEAPSSVLTDELRKEMGKAAIKVAKSCRYVGAGTVEFLYDDGAFYFLEMNTRLQVEHPVTEMIVGLDLVKEQIRIARGEKLQFKQEDIKINGHAIEARVYAEDPYNNFMPNTGRLVGYRVPQGPGVRVDDGYEEGMDIPIYYDSMISKLIVHARDRSEAIKKLALAIDEYRIVGLETTLPFCKFVLGHKTFKSGDFNTHFVADHFTPEVLGEGASDKAREVAVILAAKIMGKESRKNFSQNGAAAKRSVWKEKRLAEQ
ncbi:MAG: acetyl-CoA carboxylase biotin carboxylase subunit [Flavobacteriales bacterium]|nr:acetyl-CoA carboxylase biotin carboxylase subunit [Flavobacteriales bacterium]